MNMCKLTSKKALLKYCYDILGITKLNSKTLKKAYKEKSKIYHPDNNISGNAEKFIEVNKAYEYLKDKIVNKVIIKCPVDKLINAGCDFNINGFKFNINFDNFINYIRERKFKINGVKYSIKFLFVETNGYKFIRKNRKNIIEIPIDISIKNIYNGFIEKQIGNNKFYFKIPRNGYLKDIKKYNNINIIAKFNIIDE